MKNTVEALPVSDVVHTLFLELPWLLGNRGNMSRMPTSNRLCLQPLLRGTQERLFIATLGLDNGKRLYSATVVSASIRTVQSPLPAAIVLAYVRVVSSWSVSDYGDTKQLAFSTGSLKAKSAIVGLDKRGSTSIESVNEGP